MNISRYSKNIIFSNHLSNYVDNIILLSKITYVFKHIKSIVVKVQNDKVFDLSDTLTSSRIDFIPGFYSFVGMGVD